MLLSASSFAQGPWNFNGTADGWTATNSTATAGASALDWDITAQWNKLTITSPGVDTTSSGSIIAVTLKNTTTNANLIVGVKNSGQWSYIRTAGVPTEASEFSTFYVDLSGLARWNGTLAEILLRMRINSSGNGWNAGNVFIDKIEMVMARHTYVGKL